MGTLADLAESGDADALSAAIADGANLDEADDEGNTATHKAAQGEPECLRLLLSHGATVDSANAEGSTPLIEAVKYGDRECVAIILEAGAAMAHLDATGRPGALGVVRRHNVPLVLLVQNSASCPALRTFLHRSGKQSVGAACGLGGLDLGDQVPSSRN